MKPNKKVILPESTINYMQNLEKGIKRKPEDVSVERKKIKINSDSNEIIKEEKTEEKKQSKTQWLFGKPKNKEDIAEARRLEKNQNYQRRKQKEAFENTFGDINNRMEQYDRKLQEEEDKRLKNPAFKKYMELLAETSNPQGFKRFKGAHENKDDNKKINKGFIKKETKETKDKKETKDSPSDRPKVLTTQDVQRKYHERIQREKEEKERLKQIKPKENISTTYMHEERLDYSEHEADENIPFEVNEVEILKDIDSEDKDIYSVGRDKDQPSVS